MNKICKCCGAEQRQTSTASITFNNKEMSSVPIYNIPMITSCKGIDICEECMSRYTYLDALFSNTDLSRGGIQYYSDGREPTKVKI